MLVDKHAAKVFAEAYFAWSEHEDEGKATAAGAAVIAEAIRQARADERVQMFDAIRRDWDIHDNQRLIVVLKQRDDITKRSLQDDPHNTKRSH